MKEAQPRLRTSKACETCRATKSRCVFVAGHSACRRCEQTDSQCSVRAKARPKRAPAGASHVQTSEAVPEISIKLPGVPYPNSAEILEHLDNYHSRIFDEDETSPIEDDPVCKREAISGAFKPPGAIEKHTVTMDEARRLLAIYRHQCIYFPFVVIPPEATVQSLARTSPFLLLSILTTAAYRDPLLRHQLEHEFKRVLSSKVICEEEKSLDYLQGVLIYLAWYPFYTKPKYNQAFMYLNVAVSLTVDLGLDREDPSMNSFTGVRMDGLIENNTFSTTARLAYLGCYYLSSIMSTGFGKPKVLQDMDVLEYHCRSLLKDGFGTVPISLIKLQLIAEKMYHYVSIKSPDDSDMNSLYADINVELLQSELEEWRKSTPTDVMSHPVAAMADRFVGICVYSHRLGFVHRPYQRPEPIAVTAATPSQVSHMYCCQQAVKRFFEYLLSVPESHYWEFTVGQWSSMVLAVLVASRLTFLMAAEKNWDPDTTRQSIPLGMYLDCLCYRFGTLTSYEESDVGKKPPDSLFIFRKLVSSVKQSYERRVSKIRPGSFVTENGVAVGDAKGRCPMFEPGMRPYFEKKEESSPVWGASPAGTYSGNSESSNVAYTPRYHDLWATMTGTWAEEL
ncbi:hypothetical protein F5884DRAFT_860163 [Xylogone sp. PMI_703]|nr:hypothetical protein F5884DRAFT_860163 [Xylogone sp. PMI_703]